MTPFTDRLPSASRREPYRERDRGSAERRAQAVAAAMLGGVVAAGMGVAALGLVVLFMWITSPYPNRGPQAVLHIAGALWLLAHGAQVLRTSTLTGAPVPVGMTPLLLTALPVWVVHRATVQAVLTAEESAAYGEPGHGRYPGTGEYPEEPAGPLGSLALAGWLVAGYLLVAACAVLYTGQGVLRGDPLSALLHVPAVVVPAALAGAWTGCGRPSAIRLAAALPCSVRRPLALVPLPYAGAGTAVRAAAAAVAVLVAGGALLSTGALVWHGHAAREAFERLSGSLPGRFGVLLVAAALVPNSAVWGAAYALGPGFAVGTGGTVTITGAHGYPPVLPGFPLLAELPAPGGHPAGPTPAWLALLVPAAGCAVLVRYVTDAAVDHEWTWLRTATVALLAAGCCAAVTSAVAALAGGPLGVGTLSRFGPSGPRTGWAALEWTVALGLPATLAVRCWRLRDPLLGQRLAGRARRLLRRGAAAAPEQDGDVDVPTWFRTPGTAPAGDGGAPAAGERRGSALNAEHRP